MWEAPRKDNTHRGSLETSLRRVWKKEKEEEVEWRRNKQRGTQNNVNNTTRPPQI